MVVFPFAYVEFSRTLALWLFSSATPESFPPLSPLPKHSLQPFIGLLIDFTCGLPRVVMDEDSSKPIVFCMIGLSVEDTHECI